MVCNVYIATFEHSNGCFCMYIYSIVKQTFINWAHDIGRRRGYIIVTKTSTSDGPGNKNPSLNLDVRGVGVI